MELLNEIYIPEFESQIYKSPIDNKYYTKIEHITDNIFFPLNIISEQNIKKCAIMIIINSGYIVESMNAKYENNIKLIFELLFYYKNSFNKLFDKYNLKYENKIYPDKIIIYLEFDYLGLNPIFSSFIKNLIFFDKLIIQNNIKDILNSIKIANDINTSYLSYKKFFQKNSVTNEINNNREMNLLEFFQYYFLKNQDKYITILSPYPNDNCKNIITNIFAKLKKDIKNNIFKSYEKYTSLNIKFLPFDDPSILVVRKIDIDNNNILKLKFYFPSLTYDTENILEYIVYMINGKRIGSIYYHLFKNLFIIDLKAYTKYSYNMPPQIIIKMKLCSNISQFSLKIIISKFINFLKKLKSDINNIKITYENFQKMLLLNFNNNNKEINNYYFLYEFTNNFISLRKNLNNQNNSNKYLNLLINRFLLPEYNSSLIINILDEIISLKNLFIITELYPKLYSNFSDSIKRINTIIINNSMETNIFDTYIYAILKKQEILNYAFTTNQYDNSSFKHKQDKKKYLSKEPITNINNNDNKILLNNNSKIQLGLNTIANKLWYYISDDDDIKNSNMVFSKFHIIHPNIRNHTNNIYNINIKYYNYIEKKIEQEFEEIFEMGNEIKLTRDDNGFNLELKAFKDIYIKILEKIFSFFFEFENDFIEYGDVNYTTEYFKNDFDKAIKCLHSALKNDIIEKYFEDKNRMMNLFKLQLYGMNLEDNIHIDGFIYGSLDIDIIKKIKNVLLECNTREYDSNSIFENTTEFKKKVFDTKKINEGNIYVYKLTGDFREHFINYYISFYQIPNSDRKKYFFLILIYLLIKKHLNMNNCKVYIIFIDEIYYILILRKSFDYPEYMAKNISLNIKKLIDICNNKSDKDLIQILLDLKSQFSEEILNQKFKYDFFWSEIYNGTYNFEFEIKSEKDFEDYIINKIDLNEFKNYFKNNFFFKQRKIEFLYYQGSIKYFNNNINKNKDSYPWNLDFIDNNGFMVHEIYYNINKIN